MVATVTANGGTASLNLPPLNKARVYFSTNSALLFTAFEESPALNDGTQLFDFVEYDYSAPGATFTADTSCVEAFALPFKIESTPPGTVNGVPSAVGIDAGGRTRVFAAMEALGAPWSNLIVRNGKTPTRLLAPWHGDLASPAFPANYLDPSIAMQWGKAMRLNTYLTNPVIYYKADAVSNGAAWTFKPESGTGESVSFAQPPSSTRAFSCDIPYQSKDAGVGQRITAMLAAGLNRGTLLYPNLTPFPIPFTPVTPGQPDFTPADFYLTGAAAPAVPQVNQYANVLHQNSIKNYQYGFASDDQGSQSSTPTCPTIQSLSVTVSSF